MKLMLDESDAIFYHAENFAGHAVDPLLWSPLPGGFNRWVEMYHQEVLRQTRPVVVTIHVSVDSLGGSGGSSDVGNLWW